MLHAEREISAAPEPVQFTPPMPSPPSVTGANVSASTSSVSATSQSLLGSIFAPSPVAQAPLQYQERAQAAVVAKPPSLCLTTDASSSLFSAPLADRPPPPSPSPSPHMSATALLQKAAQMGATSSSSSYLRGLGLDISSSSPVSTSSGQQHNQHQHQQQEATMHVSFPEGSLPQWPPRLEPEPAPMMSAGLGLGLPYELTGGPVGNPELMMGHQSSLFSAKPATLDFLGLGMSPTGPSASRGLSVFMQPMGGPIGMAGSGAGAAETYGAGRGAQAKPWERNPSSSPIL